MNRTCPTITKPSIRLSSSFSVLSPTSIEQAVFQTEAQALFVNYLKLTACDPVPTYLSQVFNITISGEGTDGVFGITPLTLSSLPLISTTSVSESSRTLLSTLIHIPSRGLSALGRDVFVIPCLLALFFWRDYRQRKMVIAVEKEDQTVDGSQLYPQQNSELQAEER